MNKVFALITALLFLPLTTQAVEYKEGTHYEVVRQTATEKPEVMEFFSFYCPHCFTFEPLIATLKKNLDKDVVIRKNHVDFLGKQMGPQLTRAYAAAELLKIEDKVTSLIFDQIQTQHQNINGEQGILAIFEKAGIDNNEAKGALVSFPVVGAASQMKRNTETFKISGVPTIIVNGKYKVKTGSIKSTDEFVALVDFLTKMKD